MELRRADSSIARPVPLAPREPSREKLEPVLLIHGTFANKADPDKPAEADWWLPGSGFCNELDALLRNRSCDAQCWAHLGKRPGLPMLATYRREPFAWSGANSERERFDAGRALARDIEQLELDPGITRYHLVGHSHGGNVILNALRALPARPAKLGGVIFMGTPVLAFTHPDRFDMRRLAIPLYALALGATAWAYTRSMADSLLLATVGLAILIALIMEWANNTPRSSNRAANLYGSGVASAFAFGTDEAIRSLRLANAIIDTPDVFVAQFTKPEPPARPAVPPALPPLQDGVASEIRRSGAWQVLQHIQANMQPRAYTPGLGTSEPVIVPQPSIWSSTLTIMSAFPGPMIVVAGVLALCAIVPSLIVATVVGLVGMLGRALSTVASWLGLRLAMRLGRSALPRLVKSAAFGADLGRFDGLPDWPPEPVQREPIGDQLQREAASISDRLGGVVGKALLGAIQQGDALSIRTYVHEALANPELAHSHYYRAAEIRQRIAALIARPAATEERGGPLMSMRFPALRALIEAQLTQQRRNDRSA